MLIDTIHLNQTTQQEAFLGLFRPELRGHSNLAHLPVHSPERKLAAPEFTGERTIVKIGEVEIGGPEIVLMSGPCALESEEQIWLAATAAKNAGAKILRGGAFKPRTSVYSFQGMGEEGLQIQREAADSLNMLVVSEATGERNVGIVAQYADIIQIGARNSQNFELLAAIGLIARDQGKSVLYKRGPWMNLSEWIEGAEYILSTGLLRERLMLCERGTKLTSGTTDFDIDGVRAVRALTHLPIIGDPTHATKSAAYVPPLAQRALQAGVDGLLIEVHPYPNQALCDGPRALLPEQLHNLSTTFDAHLPLGRSYTQSSKINI